MKEFMIRHPWMTFFAVLSLIEGITNVAKIVAVSAMTKNTIVMLDDEEEEGKDEPAGDIQ